MDAEKNIEVWVYTSKCETCDGEGTLSDGSCGDIDCCGAGDGLFECWDCKGTGKAKAAQVRGGNR